MTHEEEMKLVFMPEPPPEFQTEAEKTAYAFGWWKALESVRAEKQEPVASGIIRTLVSIDKDGIETWKHEPFYTSPPPRQPEPVIDKSAAIRIATALGWTPPRQPLTENEIKHLWYEACKTDVEPTAQLVVCFARAVEQAHDIKEEA